MSALTATLHISPSGTLAKVPRDYLVTLELPFEAQAGAEDQARDFVKQALSGISTEAAAIDRITVRPVTRPGKPGKDGVPLTVTTAFEAELICSGMPDIDALERVRATLKSGDYRVIAQERRVCTEPVCTADAILEWSAAKRCPTTWYDERICGRHNYRSCAACGSVYRLQSEASNGPAPSLHCSVCGVVMIEWGGSKVWEAELLEAQPAPKLN